MATNRSELGSSALGLPRRNRTQYEDGSTLRTRAAVRTLPEQCAPRTLEHLHLYCRLTARWIDRAWLLDGPMDRAAFTTYVEHCLGPTLSPGDIVIADNLSSHKGPAITAAIERCGAKLVFLPPYSPDRNPIELAFSKLKSYLRATAGRTFEALLAHLMAALDSFLPQHCANFFRHCCYATT